MHSRQGRLGNCHQAAVQGEVEGSRGLPSALPEEAFLDMMPSAVGSELNRLFLPTEARRRGPLLHSNVQWKHRRKRRKATPEGLGEEMKAAVVEILAKRAARLAARGRRERLERR